MVAGGLGIGPAVLIGFGRHAGGGDDLGWFQMRRIWIAFAVAATVWAAPYVKRAALIAMEKSFDQRIVRLADDPYLLVGDTRGVYLEGYGAVFTAEVNLANGPSLS